MHYQVGNKNIYYSNIDGVYFENGELDYTITDEYIEVEIPVCDRIEFSFQSPTYLYLPFPINAD